MPYVTIVFALILMTLGIVGYFQSGQTPDADSAAVGDNNEDGVQETAEGSRTDEPKGKSITALIPTLFGLGMLICGTLALKTEWLKHAMHGAATVALIAAVLGLGRAAMKLSAWMSGEMTAAENRAFQMVALMSIVSLIFIGLCINSFIAARRAREAAEASAASQNV